MASIEIIISEKIKKKLSDRHKVSRGEIEQCFYNRQGPLLTDTREDHQTSHPTQWFVGETDRGRLLKVIFVLQDCKIYLKSAYNATDKVIQLYKKLGAQ